MTTNDGLSQARLERLQERMAQHVAAGLLPGAVWLIERRGRLHVGQVGTLGLEDRRPMARDTIFRITSMTKPIAAVATLMLVEECALHLDDAVERWLPELADRRVLRRADGPLDETVPAERSITVRDLLTNRMGFGMLFGDAPIKRAEAELQLGSLGAPWAVQPPAPDEWLRRFATLPLMAQPGRSWLYNTSSCVLGVLLARVSGRTLPELLQERIFAPLGMKDTGFAVAPEKLPRLAPAYFVDGKGALIGYGDAHQASTLPDFASAASGLFSTVDDYHAFARMLADGGRHAGGRLLTRPTVLAMTTNQLRDASERALSPWLDEGWGFGVGVWSERSAAWATPGRYGWDGGSGTSWANDPSEQLTAILMTHRSQMPTASPTYQDFWSSVYAAIDD